MPLLNRLNQLESLLKNEDLKSYDPYDGMSSPFAPVITFNNQFLSRIVQQTVFRAPVNLRPLLGIKKLLHTKATSDFVSGFAYRFAATHHEEYKQQCFRFLQHLEDMMVVTEDGRAWGLRFSMANRFVKKSASEPNIFQTINAINAYLDVHELVDETISLAPVFDAVHYIKNVFDFTETPGYVFWNYWKRFQNEVYNVNGLMVGVLSRLYKLTGENEYKVLAQKTYQYLKLRQNEDGSWFYAHGNKAKFIDGFHTGYILEGMCRGVINDCIDADEAFEKGVSFYLKNLFTEDFTPKYFHNSITPHDAQNGAQAIQTLVFLSKLNLVAPDFVINVAKRVDVIFWNSKGYYDFIKKKGLYYSVPMHRWATGPMFLALSLLNYEFKSEHTYAEQHSLCS